MVNIIVNILFLFFGIHLFLMINKRYSSVINHVSIFTSVWLFIILGSQLSGYVVFQLNTLVVVYLSWYFYLFGSYLSESEINIDSIVVKILDIEKIKIACYVLVVLSFFANLTILKDVFFNFSSFEVWAKMRNDQAFSDYRDGNYFYTVFGNTSNIYLPLAIYLFMEKKINSLVLIVVYLVSILIAVAAFTRAPMLYLIIISIVFFTYQAKRVPYKLILTSFTVLVLLFAVSSYFIGEVSQGAVDTNSAINLYLYGGITAYQNLLNGKYFTYDVFDSSYYSFDFINYILKTFRIIKSYPDLVREYDQDLPTNVYTYLDCFTLDFGFMGAFLGSYILGYISKIIYLRYYRNQSIFDLILYSTICYFASFIFMNNEYIRFTFVLFIVKIFIIKFLIRFKFEMPTLTT
ncbi:oligosaccharide repeat unit polymerase [Flavobacterium franklandianum]|uniref:Oligosaccharide repeat unit polymerase n=2 Tax=Flavobacterium franklandianum TaxID=2594430 RepID=A0A553CK40_9FLAO|nr:oligosaccharide repeat unit polymerase [Flavobacterium franklandianum]TRX29449.1 oligosaccharide repeat unit polymerase [Flavobacterium franklandianum]